MRIKPSIVEILYMSTLNSRVALMRLFAHTSDVSKIRHLSAIEEVEQHIQSEHYTQLSK